MTMISSVNNSVNPYSNHINNQSNRNIRPSTITENVWSSMSQENRERLLNSQEEVQRAIANEPMMSAASRIREHFVFTQALHMHYDPEARSAREAGNLSVSGRLAEELDRLASGGGMAVTLPETLPDFELVNQNQNVASDPIMQILNTLNLN
jgi:hypothetical protein